MRKAEERKIHRTIVRGLVGALEEARLLGCGEEVGVERDVRKRLRLLEGAGTFPAGEKGALLRELRGALFIARAMGWHPIKAAIIQTLSGLGR